MKSIDTYDTAIRIIQVNLNLQRHKQIARQNLWSEMGIYLRKKRCIEPEPVFGQIKWNRGFKRFLLRGLPKVTCEFGNVAIAHNLKKMWSKIQQARIEAIPPVLPPENAQKLGKNTQIDLWGIFIAVIHWGTPCHGKTLFAKVAA